MDNVPPHVIRSKLDRVGIAVSGVCALHCLASIFLVSGLGLGSQLLLSPDVHRIGLVLAVIIASIAIGWGALKHRKLAPFVIAMMGLTFMTGALAVPHGVQEATLTLIGVGLVTLGHVLNINGAAAAKHHLPETHS